MVLQLVLALSACVMSLGAAGTVPASVQPSFFHPSGFSPTWSRSSIGYTQPSWPTTVSTWSISLYTSEGWSSSYVPSLPTPTWPTTWYTPTQPVYSSSWSASSNAAPTWSSGAPTWSSWPSSFEPSEIWSSGAPTWSPWPSSFEPSETWPAASAWPSPSPPPPPTLPSLNDALIAAGAAKFAALIQSDPVVSAAYAAGVSTVFAPTDEYIGDTFNASGLRKRSSLTPLQQQQLLLHSTQNQSDINGLRTPPGKVVTTKDSTANLNGTTQKVVTDPRNTTKSTNSRRWLSSILPRQDNGSSVTTLVNIFSGLGDSVGILNGDISYDGGVIHTTDGLFTVPLTLSSTAQSTGQTTFVSLTNPTNQTTVLDNTPLITVFVPTNDAFATAGISSNSTGIASLLAGHVLQNFVGYLPSLTNGSSFVTQAGTTVTVTIQGEDYFVNNAKIVSSNLILENGVAHVIDSVLTAPIAPYTGAGSSLTHTSVPTLLALVLGIIISLVWSG